jgi:multiple sugar transport system permease protein
MKRRPNRDGLAGMAFVGPGFLYILLIVVYPLAFSLWASFTNMRLTSPVANFVGFDTYRQALGNEIFRDSLIVTAMFLVTVVLVEFILGFALAFSFSRMRNTHAIMRALLLLPIMATPVSVGLIWKLMLNSDFGIITGWGELFGFGRVLWLSEPVLAFFSIVIMDVWQWTPFTFLILLAGLEGLPREPLESAAVDGASPLQSLIHVTLPLMKRIIVIAVVFRLMFAIATFDTVYVLTKGGPARATDLITLFIQREGFVNLNIAFASAVSFLVLIAVLIATTLLFKRELSDAK